MSDSEYDRLAKKAVYFDMTPTDPLEAARPFTDADLDYWRRSTPRDERYVWTDAEVMVLARRFIATLEAATPRPAGVELAEMTLSRDRWKAVARRYYEAEPRPAGELHDPRNVDGCPLCPCTEPGK